MRLKEREGGIDSQNAVSSSCCSCRAGEVEISTSIGMKRTVPTLSSTAVAESKCSI